MLHDETYRQVVHRGPARRRSCTVRARRRVGLSRPCPARGICLRESSRSCSRTSRARRGCCGRSATTIRRCSTCTATCCGRPGTRTAATSSGRRATRSSCVFAQAGGRARGRGRRPARARRGGVARRARSCACGSACTPATPSRAAATTRRSRCIRRRASSRPRTAGRCCCPARCVDRLGDVPAGVHVERLGRFRVRDFDGPGRAVRRERAGMTPSTGRRACGRRTGTTSCGPRRRSSGATTDLDARRAS